MALHLPQPPQAYDPTDQAQMRRILELEDKKNRKVALDAAGDVVDDGSALTGGGESPLIVPQGRLTLASGVPFLTSDVTGATTVFYTPAVGDRAPIYNAATGKWGTHRFAELSQALSDNTRAPAAAVANANYDYFLGLDAGGNVALYRGPLWQKSAPVTMTIAAPAVVTWNAHGLAGGAPVSFATTGALPTGIVAGTTYYVGGSTSTVTMTIASPCVVTWNAHGISAGHAVSFSTTGALPTGIVAGNVYYVMAVGLTTNTFQLSATIGGAAINTSGVQSGVHTAHGPQNVPVNTFFISAVPFGNFITTSGSQSGVHTATADSGTRGAGAGTTELEVLNGVYVNKYAITNGPAARQGTYIATVHTVLGTILNMQFEPTSLPGGTFNFLCVFNAYNRRIVCSNNRDNTDNWTYSTPTWRARHGSIASGIYFVVGLAEDAFDVWSGTMTAATAVIFRGIVINLNAATGAPTLLASSMTSGIADAAFAATSVHFKKKPGIGLNYVMPMEFAASATSTFYGDNGTTESNCQTAFSFPM